MLATAIQKARDNSMPRTTSSARSTRGSGSATEGESYETVTYEGYGDGGVAVFVEALTDNQDERPPRSNTSSPSTTATSGRAAVAWLFGGEALSRIPGAVDEDELMLVAADGGADDVEPGDQYRVIAAPDDLAAVRAALNSAGIPFESAELTMLPERPSRSTTRPPRRSFSASWTRSSRRTTTCRRCTPRFDIPEEFSKPSQLCVVRVDGFGADNRRCGHADRDQRPGLHGLPACAHAAGGCPSELRSDEVVDVVVLWSPERPLTETEQRAKVFGHLREWCAANPGVKANVLS